MSRTERSGAVASAHEVLTIATMRSESAMASTTETARSESGDCEYEATRMAMGEYEATKMQMSACGEND